MTREWSKKNAKILDRALDYQRQGWAAEAHRHLEQAVEGAPDNPEFHLDFCVALGDLGRVDDSIGLYRTALALAPGTQAALANLGFCPFLISFSWRPLFQQQGVLIRLSAGGRSSLPVGLETFNTQGVGAYTPVAANPLTGI